MKYTIVLCMILWIACQKTDFDIINLNNNRISVLGHGGAVMGHTYPMNSYEAVKNCLNLGADGTEIDVQMTKDGVLVAFHDEFLEQSVNVSGQVYRKTWSEIKQATFKEFPFTRYKLVTLDQLFRHLPDRSAYTFFLDCKNFNPDRSSTYLDTFNDALISIIDRHHLGDNLYIELKSKDLIRSLRSKRPDLKIFAYADFDAALAMAREFQLPGIVIPNNRISKEQVALAHQKGIMVAVFNTFTKSSNMEAIDKNVDFIQADKLKHLIKVLE